MGKGVSQCSPITINHGMTFLGTVNGAQLSKIHNETPRVSPTPLCTNPVVTNHLTEKAPVGTSCPVAKMIIRTVTLEPTQLWVPGDQQRPQPLTEMINSISREG